MLRLVAVRAASSRAAFRAPLVNSTLHNNARSNRFASLSSTARKFSTVGPSGDGDRDVAVGSTSVDSSVDPNALVDQVVDQVMLVDPPISSLGFGPTETIMRVIQSIHEYGGLPWWASIVAMTVIVRTAILPLTIMSQKNTANLVRASPELEEFKADVRLNPPKTVEDQMRNSMRLREIYSKYNISMKKTLAPLVVQMPLFITFFLGLRRLAQTYPTMKEGGALWFTDLSVADPTYALPVIAAGTFLLTIEMGGEVQNPQMDQKMMKNIMRGLGVAMVPLTMTFESGIFVYWVSTNLFSAVQIGTLKQPAVKKLLGLPETIKPPPGPSNIMKPSFFEQLDKMTRPVNQTNSSSPSTSSTSATPASTEATINDQFVSEMKEARSRRSRRRQG